MSTPLPTPTPDAITDALTTVGITGSGGAADAWRAELRTNAALAAHLQSIAAAVSAAQQRATTALDAYTAAAPSAAEIDAAQHELLAASLDEDTRNPRRLQDAEDKLGELLGRRQRAEDDYHRDSSDNVDELAADRHAADEELSPEARAKLQQLLSSLGGTPGAAMPAGAPPSAPAAAAGYPPPGYTPTSEGSDGSDSSGFSPTRSTEGDEPVQTHTSSDPTPVSSQPTLTNATTTAQVGAPGTPVATSGPTGSTSQSGLGAAGAMSAPMAPGMMGGMGAGAPHGSAKRDGDTTQPESGLDRDGLLNGDDLLNRSVKGRL